MSLVQPDLAALRARIARIEAAGARPGLGVLPVGAAPIDGRLPGGGLQIGALHEVAGDGPDLELAAAPALFVAGLLARRPGPVLWAAFRSDLYPPALAAAGLTPDRVIYVQAGAEVLLVMEEALRQPGLAGVVGEVGKLTLTQSRRLQLAAETGGGMGMALRRFRRGADAAIEAALAEPNAAVTRWRVTPAPSAPPVPEAPDVPGLGPPRWRLDLARCRGGTPASWMVEAWDAQGRLRVVADAVDRQAAPQRRLAG